MKFGPIQIWEVGTIGSDETDRTPLMVRYKLLAIGGKCGLYIHHFLRSDYDRALHDHPWGFIALILKGGYTEVHDQPEGRIHATTTPVSYWRSPGTLMFRPPKWRHRVVLKPGTTSWSLTFVGPRVRRWGFWLPEGWCWWKQHNHRKNICEDHQVHFDGGD